MPKSAKLVPGERLHGRFVFALGQENSRIILILRLLVVGFLGFRLRRGCGDWLLGGLSSFWNRLYWVRVQAGELAAWCWQKLRLARSRDSGTCLRGTRRFCGHLALTRG